MRKSINERQKLYPLRYFVVDGLYEMPYLSILAQRKKLKTKKIGRNYYTCHEWFDEYLEKHACDQKREIYKQEKTVETEYIRAKVTADKPEISKDSKKTSQNIKIFILKTAIVSVAVFCVLFFSNKYIFHSNYDKGIVAGDEEIASSTKESFIAD